MKVLNKVKWVLGILMVFVIIITTNLIDRSNFQRVKESATTIYEDRLIAKDLIYDLANAIHEKEIATVRSDMEFFNTQNNAVNQRIDDLTLLFQETKLTTNERQIFATLQEELLKLNASEQVFIGANFNNSETVLKRMAAVKTHLNSLSDIQLSEGKKQVSITRKAVDAVELFTQIEIYVLIFLGIVIQIIILYNPKDSIE
jgi:hypothetical protein